MSRENPSSGPDQRRAASQRRRRLIVAVLVLIGGIGGAAMVVAAQDVQISSVTITPETPVTGETTTIETTVSNLESSSGSVEVTDLYIRTSGKLEEHARLEDVGSIESGGSLTIPVAATFEDPGEKRLTVRVVARDQSGASQRYEYPLYVNVEESSVRADLATQPANRSDSTEVVLSNYGNTDLTDVEISARTDGTVLDRGYTFDVAPGTSESATFDTSNLTGESVNFTANYQALDESYSTSHVTEIGESEGVSGEIRLTRVNARPGASGLTLEGEAANIGSSSVESVLLRIPDAEGVSQGDGGEYFIGPVEGSEFATFELTADVPEDRDSVPVEIRYNVDGERKTKTQTVQVPDGNTSANRPSPGQGQQAGQDGAPGGPGSMPGGPGGPGGPGQSGGLPLVPIGLVAVVLVGGFLVYKWRNQ